MPRPSRRKAQKTAEPPATALRIESASSTSVYRHQPCKRPNRAMAPSRINIRIGAAENNSKRSGREKSKRRSHASTSEQKISSAWNKAINQERCSKSNRANCELYFLTAGDGTANGESTLRRRIGWELSC